MKKIPDAWATRPAEAREGRTGPYCSTSRSAVMWHPGYRTVDSGSVLTEPCKVNGKPDVRPPRLGRLSMRQPLSPEGDGALRELPLRGHRALEIDASTAIRFSRRLLADLGADVVIVEHDDADDQLTACLLLNRGKRSIAASAVAGSYIQQILAGADVVIPGAESRAPIHQGQVVGGMPVLATDASVATSGNEAPCVDARRGPARP